MGKIKCMKHGVKKDTHFIHLCVSPSQVDLFCVCQQPEPKVILKLVIVLKPLFEI